MMPPLNFGVATDYRPFAARFNTASGFQASKAVAVHRPIQVGIVGRLYRLTLEQAVGLVESLRAQIETGEHRVRVLIPGDKWTRPTGSSGSRRSASADEACSLLADLTRAIEQVGKPVLTLVKKRSDQ